MSLSPRELVLTWLTGVAAVFGLTWWLGASQVEEWKTIREQRSSLEDQIAIAERWAAQRGRWEQEQLALRKKLPGFAEEKEAQNAFPSKLEALRKAHDLNVPARDTPKEGAATGELREMAVHWTWDGPLDSIVHFLYDLQASEDMLDVGQLGIRPAPGKAGQLQGDFTVNFAYTLAGADGKQPKDEKGGKEDERAGKP